MEIIQLGERFLKGRQTILAAANITDKKLMLREKKIEYIDISSLQYYAKHIQ